MKVYEAPKFSDLGTLEELTEATFNKVGSTPDEFSAITGGVVVGSLVVSP